MTVTLAATALGRVVKISFGGSLRDFYVHLHQENKTVLVQAQLESTKSMQNPTKGTGYLGGESDTYLAGDYTNNFSADVRVVMPTDIILEKSTAGATMIASRTAFILSQNDYLEGGAPKTTSAEYWTSDIYSNSGYVTLTASGESAWHSYDKKYSVRPCIALPNNTLVNDDGTLVVVSQDAANLLPCIKY